MKTTNGHGATRSPAATMDPKSLLAEVDGSTTLDALETDLSARGLTLGVPLEGDRGGLSVAAWLSRGAPGAPSAFSDPADHLVAGLEATLTNGKGLVIRPAPRRAVGPDLAALVLGAYERFAKIDRAWLRVHRRDARPVREPLPAGDLDPVVSEAEALLLQAIERELSRP